jgi:hypothetical protein
VNADNQSPETSGLLAANNGFTLVETAFAPVSLRIKPAFVWLVGVVFLVAVATAAGLIVASDLPATAPVKEVPAVAAGDLTALVSLEGPPSVEEGMFRVSDPSTAERPQAPKELRVEPVVLRGQPPSTVSHGVLAVPGEKNRGGSHTPKIAVIHAP